MDKELNGLVKKIQAKVKRAFDKNKKPEPPPIMTEKLTDEQIENWRKVLCLQLGPYALLMPKEDIQRLRDKMQAQVNSITPEDLEKMNKESSNV